MKAFLLLFGVFLLLSCFAFGKVDAYSLESGESEETGALRSREVGKQQIAPISRPKEEPRKTFSPSFIKPKPKTFSPSFTKPKPRSESPTETPTVAAPVA